MRGVLLAAGVVVLTACGGGAQDQTVADYPIAYIKRPVPLEQVNNIDVLVDLDVREVIEFTEGGDVYLRDRASPSASERNITNCITAGLGDVKDLETSFDGAKLIFSLRLEDTSNGADVPKWNIYEYDTAIGGCPVRVIADNNLAADGDDVTPHYLPDGRIVFSSSMQRTTGEILLNEGKIQFSPMDESLNEPAAVLHVMDADGANIKQISFNQSHDLDASVLSSGEIVFSRWDNAGPNNAIHLYKIRPDGAGLKALYGVHEHDVGTNNSTVQFLSPRPLEDGRILAMLKPFNGSAGGGAPVIINVANYADNSQPTWPNQGILSGTGHSSAIGQDIRTDNSISPAGRYRSVYPLWDGSNRALVSWSQCRLQEITVDADDNVTRAISPCPSTIPADAIEAFPVYGIYIYDFSQGTQLPVVIPQEGVLVEEPVVLASRTQPQVLIDKVVGVELEQALADENTGILHIRSVYDFDGNLNLLGSASAALSEPLLISDADYFDVLKNPSLTSADQRSARFLRIVKAASIPDPDEGSTEFDDGSAFGRGGRNGGMREIIGYAPIEPDGSVMTKVPANVPLAISIVDKDGKRIGARHQNWIQVRPGDTLECNGCHDHSTDLPHGYDDAPTALNNGVPTVTYIFPGTNGDFAAQMGETMAEARLRVSCTNSNGVFIKTQTACPELSPNVSPSFFDVWADGADAIADAVNLRYADLNVLMAANLPATATCQGTWSSRCRTIINYENSIHPLWNLPRQDVAMNDMTCTACHTNVDAMSNPKVPDAQLDLSDGPSTDEADHFKAYRELLFPDNEVLADGTDVMVQAQDAQGNDLFLIETDANGDPVIDPATGQPVLALDAMGNPIPIMEPVRAQGPSMSINGALASGRFFDRFNTSGDQHEGLLTPAEIRLLSEWLDIGAQYFNNSFDSP
jgi:hypothetical protein